MLLPMKFSAPPTASAAPATSCSRKVVCRVNDNARVSICACSSRRRTELVADTPHIDDPAAEAGRGELAAHPRRMRLDRPCRRPAPVSPHVAQQLLAREDTVGVRSELDEQRELLLRQEHV